MQINKKQIVYNRTKRTDRIKYIVVHDTGNTDSGANAERHYRYFNGGNRGSSADIFVDDTQALQVNDYHTYYSWHCGDGHGKYGITNNNSVGVEMCINSDGDYDKAFANTVEVVKQLMSELNIDAAHVVRHYDASRKNCPASFSGNNWAKWLEFKRRLTEDIDMEELKKLTERVELIEKAIGGTMVYGCIDKNMPEWAHKAVQWCVDKGIVNGVSDDNLNLNEDRLWMCCIIYRLAQVIGKQISVKM